MTRHTRRWFLEKGALAAFALGAPRARASGFPRVGIVGGGLAGVSCAWLLDGVADSVLFESRPILGGHAHTIEVDVGGRSVLVDVGAQFFAPGPHPTYSALLELLGLTKPSDSTNDETFESEMSISVMGEGESTPRFVSPAENRSWPILAPWNRRGLLSFFTLALAAKRFTKRGRWSLSLEEWLTSLPVSEVERERLLLPLVSGTVGCSIEEARDLSARSALVFIGLAIPRNLLDPVVYRQSAKGLGGNVRFIADRCASLTIHAGSEVVSVRRLPGAGFAIESANGTLETVDVVLFATPPFVTGRLLSSLPGYGGARRALERFGYFRAEIAIHRDPVYMPENPRFWSAYNSLIDGTHCEASIWYGAFSPPEANGNPLMLFKSWATARSRAPETEIFRRAFLHPRITPDFIQAGRRLAAHQGRGGVWFAGSYTGEVDSQDTALLSAMRVVRELAPQAPNLLDLESHLAGL